MSRKQEPRTDLFQAWLFVAALLLFSGQTSAQIVSSWETDAANFLARVKNIEFFMDRFNNKTEGSALINVEQDSARMEMFRAERRGKMFSLFDLQRLNRNDQALKKNLEDFFAQVNSDHHPVFLHFNEPGWYAAIDFEAHVNGKEETVRCYLQTDRSKEGVYTWVVRSFEYEKEGLTEAADSILRFAPSVHGTDFMEVRLRLQDKTWVAEKIDQSKNPSLTLQQLASGKLMIRRVNKITYRFLQVDGWDVQIGYVNRSSANSGWLITKINPFTSEEKSDFLQGKNLR